MFVITAVVSGDYSDIDGARARSFLDLVEVMFVNALREHGGSGCCVV